MKSILWSFVFFASLACWTYAATTTTARPAAKDAKGQPAATVTPKAGTKASPAPPAKGKAGSTDTKTHRNTISIQSRIGADNSTTGSRRVITTRLGSDGVTPQQQCQCVLFYLCDQNDVLEVPANGEQCGEQLEICCLLPLNSLNDTSLPSVIGGSSSSHLPVTSSTVAPQTDGTASTTENPNACRCVLQSQCLNTTDPISGAGNIDVRIPKCSSHEVCCNPVDIVNTGNTPQSGGDTSETPVIRQSTPPVETPASSETTPTIVPDQCGVRNSGINNRITFSSSNTQSRETIFGEFPWMAIILTSEESDNEKIDNLFVCGASIVAPNIVLTAAHCVYQRDASLLKIRAGEYDTRSGSQAEPLPHQDNRATHVYIHPQYNPKVLYNDLALITTEQPFNITQHISSVCIPLINSQYAGDTVYDSRQCVATGWGKDAFGTDARYQTTLKKVDLALVSHDKCQKDLRGTRLGPYYILDRSFVCAGGEQGADTCEGDGGGPLVCALKSDPNRYVQVGIVSWGIGCGTKIPAVYASLQNNINWLNEQYTVLTTFQEQSFGSMLFRKRN